MITKKQKKITIGQQHLVDCNGLWVYHNHILDISPDAILGSQQEFTLWRNTFSKQFYKYFNSVSLSGPEKIVKNKPAIKKNYSLTEFTFFFPNQIVKGGR